MSLSELEEEMAQLQAGVAAAESRATMLEGTVQTAKDQLLRLNADFDNFRRRSVGVSGAFARARANCVHPPTYITSAYTHACTSTHASTSMSTQIHVREHFHA